jgi:hypothetical protein
LGAESIGLAGAMLKIAVELGFDHLKLEFNWVR